MDQKLTRYISECKDKVNLSGRCYSKWDIILNALQSNSNITILVLYDCGIDNAIAPLIWRALWSNTTLTELNIGGNIIGGEGLEGFEKVVNRSNCALKNVIFYTNKIDGAGVLHISRGLSSNSSVTRLSLGENNIGDLGCKHLAEMFKTNTTLQNIILYDCGITTDGSRVLLEALDHNSTIDNINVAKNSIEPSVMKQIKDKVSLDRSKKERAVVISDERQLVTQFLVDASCTEEYSRVLMDEGMLWDDLEHLEDSDLVGIGVDNRTVRKRILRAIKNRPKDQSTSPAIKPHNHTFLNEHFDVESTMKGGQHQLVTATMLNNRRGVVVKIHTNEEGFKKEMDMLTTLRSPHVVDLVWSQSYPVIDRHVLALERGVETLHDMLERGPLDADYARFLIKQSVKCVDFIHQKDIVHSDIKPKNFLVVADSPTTHRIVLIDLDGVCVAYRDTLPCEVTGSYCAPERMTTKVVKATPSADIWSLGVMIYEMLTSKRFGVGYTEDELREVLTDDSLNYFDMSLIDSKAARRMLEPMLDLDPKKRGSAADALRHSYLSGVADTDMEAMRKDVKVMRAGVGELVERE